MARIWLSVPHMGERELGFVQRAFDQNWLSSVGPNLDDFEAAFSARLQRPSVALASGTAALHLGLRLLGVAPGHEVISPTLTFIASVNPIGWLGARPVFVDCDRESWNLDPNLLERVLRERADRGKLPKAVVVVHLYGQSADMDAILEVCGRYDVPIIEDAAEALGAEYKGKPVGTFTPVAAFSFNGNKIITTTGGGMLVAKDRGWVDRARFWSTQARDPGVAYEHSEVGYNYRMSNVLAGIGLGQLDVLDLRVKQRRAVAARYWKAFEDLPGITRMPQAPWGLHTNWLSCFLVDESKLGASRDDIIRALSNEDIEARPVWKPMHLQSLFVDAPRYGGEVAEDLFRRGICLPSSSSLREDDQMRVIGIIHRLARRQ
jgi:pyridoxal phosphate-dependent aminotransferase EpsN